MANHSITYLITLTQMQGSNKFFVEWQIDPWVVGYDDYIALYESYADLQKDFDRVADGRDPTYQKTYEWVRKMDMRWWATDYDTQSGWLIAYWSKNYLTGNYQCFTWTPGW